MNNITDFYYLCEGEILEVQTPAKGDKNVVRYTIEVTLRTGTRAVFRDVEELSFFGGISDYYRRRARASFDEEDDDSLEPQSREATVGERICVAFVYGNVLKPVIVGYFQHPNQISEDSLDNESPDVNTVWQHLGFRKEFDKDGQVTFVRKGAPKVIFAPETKSFSAGESEFKGDASPAVEPQDATEERIITEWLNRGTFRVRDPKGGVFELNHTGKTGVYISDNDWKSTENINNSDAPATGGLQSTPKDTDAEYIWLDREGQKIQISARKLINIHSSENRDDTTLKNYTHNITGNSTTDISGDKVIKIKGSRDDSVDKNYTIKVTGNYEKNVNGKNTISSFGDYEVTTLTNYRAEASGSAKLTMGLGKVALGAGPIEVLQSQIEALDAIINQADKIVLTAVGPGVLNPATLAILVKVSSSLKVIKGIL